MKNIYLFGLASLFTPLCACAMHIAEGYLSPLWSALWWIAILPMLIVSLKKLRKINANHPTNKIILAMATAFVFLLSSLKLPSVAGSSSHLTGIALGAILFGTSAMTLIGFTVLLFQALLLAHGGVTTLGANVFSMAIIGATVAILLYKGLYKITKSYSISIAIASFISSLSIYACTSFQLALAHGHVLGFMSAFGRFLSVFMITQIPLSLIEAVLTVLLFNYLQKYNSHLFTLTTSDK